ncbi:CDP-glycerol glycerophosphotransferase family protein [Diaminobutyricimonas sp. LJ205]|uniref:CDP-glycerol glycerophosphotransferase family protein n=1 Tax=Diaminobutyricimonas sp. LJ205 TaxID=2683590 RepID=UPI0012F4B59E|nr:CDP-glycerol glycerophosphotransferase family protein [Diaminobutyricimonas sp. LJ205]
MSRFTFASGNAAKLLSVPLYVAGAIATRFVRRRNDLWVFGSGSGVGEGSLALLQTVRRQQPDLRIAWLARDESDLARARELGIRAVLKDSWRGFRLTLRARVIVVTHGFGDANRFAVRGGFIVQLWHGIPLKRIQLDAPTTFAAPGPLRGLLRRLYRRTAQNIDLVTAAGAPSAERLRTAFGVPEDRIAITGDPRDDLLSRGSSGERRATADTLLHSLLQLAGSPRVIMFAPTWRDGNPDPGLPSDTEWQRIGEWLENTRSVLVVRPHPHSVGDYEGGPTHSRRILLLDATALRDITPVLPAVDALITDYSSIAFDYALTGGPIYFLAADVAEYGANRGLYEPYERFSGGREVHTWPALLEVIDRADTDPTLGRAIRAHSDDLRRRFHAYADGRNSHRVYTQILERLKEVE